MKTELSMETLPPDTQEGDKIFHEFYLKVVKEHSRRQQRKVVEDNYLAGRKK